MDKKWDSVRDRCDGFDYEFVIENSLQLVKKGTAPRPVLSYWEEDESSTDLERLIRQHFSHTAGDSGIPNMMHRVENPGKVIVEEAKKILEMTFETLIQRIDSNHYDARDITEEGLYNWRHFFHNGSEFEIIHIAILIFGDEELRTDWSRTLSEAFMISRKIKE